MENTETVVTEIKKKKVFANGKFYREDFSNQDLANADFRSATLVECNFTGADCDYANFESANCYGSNFTGTKLHRANFKDTCLNNTVMEPKDIYGACITLSCETFDNMKPSKMWWYIWLCLALRMEVPEKADEAKLIEVMGKEKYATLARLFDSRRGVQG